MDKKKGKSSGIKKVALPIVPKSQAGTRPEVPKESNPFQMPTADKLFSLGEEDRKNKIQALIYLM